MEKETNFKDTINCIENSSVSFNSSFNQTYNKESRMDKKFSLLCLLEPNINAIGFSNANFVQKVLKNQDNRYLYYELYIRFINKSCNFYMIFSRKFSKFKHISKN